MVQIEGRDLEWSELGRNRKAKNDKPVRRRCSNFRMDRTEVTNQQYAEFLSASAANARFYDPRMDIVALDSTHFRAVAGKENFPVTFIDWLGAYTFASWAGKSLPTEDEWLLAALGSRRLQPSAVVYPWGDEVPDSTRANCVSSRMAPSVSRVASFPAGATPTQLSDMGGNVAEWTLTEGKIVLSDGKEDSWIVVKGGSFLDAGSQLSLTKRSLRKRDERLGSLGFRCIVREGASQ
ncbi:MAG: formylglycine-generating enzyme family protein [bacterium]|nr:formylglycine-generating enzyme family protein [bacterium]